jgi:hypothetical protein
VLGVATTGFRPRRWYALVLPIVAGNAEPFAHVIAAVTPVVTREAVHREAVRRGRRQRHAKASIFLAVSRARRKHLIARNLAAERARNRAQIEELRVHQRPPFPLSGAAQDAAATSLPQRGASGAGAWRGSFGLGFSARTRSAVIVQLFLDH